MKVGDTVRLVVDENLSTGYEWIYQSHLERGLLNDEVVYSVEIDEHRAHTRLGTSTDTTFMAGTGGTRVF